MSSLLSARRRHTLLFLGLVSSLILLVACPSCIPRVESRKTSLSTSPDKTAPSAVAVGFDLGQSYGTSVARFENGTAVPLAKIQGGAVYVALMERLIAEPTTPHWLSHVGSVGRWLGLLRALKRSLGLSPTNESYVLAEMVATLKSASETILQIPIETVAVTAPWMAAWDNQVPADSVINDALLLAGIEPWSSRDDSQNYLGEINTALVNEELWVCKKHWCTGHGMEVEGEAAQGGPVFFISFTNHSLHTSFQLSKCYFFNSWDNHLASIDPRYGLDKENQATFSARFWNEFKEHLLSLVKQHTTRDRACHSPLPLTVLVTGEAADNPRFLKIVHDVIRSIPKLCASGPKAPEWKGSGAERGTKLVIPDDPTYASAKGAAFWLWTRMNRTYCSELYAREGTLNQYDMVRDARVEL